VQASITAAQARDALDRIVAAAAAAGMPIAVAIVDARGDLVASFRMDGAHPRFMNVAIRKAYTAAMREQTTDALHEELVRRNIEIGNFGDPMFTCLPGGFYVVDAGGVTIAGIGVTGRTRGRDEEFGRAGVAAFGAGATSPG
jgi:glc operon protein GlcG